MSIKGKRFLLAAGALGLIFAGAGPALAQNHGGGGGGGHSSGGGGGHIGGGGGGAHLTGGGHVGGGHATGAPHFSGGAAHYGGGHYAAPAHIGTYGYGGHGVSGAYHGAGGYRGGYYGGHAYPGHYYGGHGYSTGAYWHGGYWHGGFWPRCYYGVGFSWFLPILPLAYATYWWGGVPYYYANDVYYTWSPDYQGYVATDPPPATESSDSGAASAPADAPPPEASGDQYSGQPAQIFMYPKNGQSAEQQTQDRTECQQWAAQQAGSVAQNGPDYNRAMVACVEGRGYSAR